MRKKQLQREFKDRLFLISFSERKDLLELYNAMHGTDYQNPDDLQITTLDDVIYIGVKNDVSFLLDDMLNLWEHQSTPNPNMPIRGLSYLAELYQKYIEQNNINIYSRRLKEYAQFVDRVRGNIGTGKLAIEAVNEAVDSCIRDGILGDILSAHKAEVVAMFLYEFDEEKYRKMEREEMREEVREEVRGEVREEVRGEVLEEVQEAEREKAVRALVEICRECQFTREKTVAMVAEKYDVSGERLEQYMEKYWS